MSEPPSLSTAELLTRFAKHRGKLERWFQQRLTKDEIAKRYIGSPTYRRLRTDKRTDKRKVISTVLVEWARTTLEGPLFMKVLNLKKQPEYDEWLKECLCSSLCDYCKQHGVRHATGPLSESYGPKTKIANLFMKHAVCWDNLAENDRTRLIPLLHVPFDRDSLIGLKDCAKQSSWHGSIGDINKPGMEFVKTARQYDALQNLARGITDAAEPKAPPIYLDVLFWNVPRLYKLAEKLIGEAGGIEEAKDLMNDIAISDGKPT